MANSLGEMVVAITGNTDDFNLSIDQAGKKFDSLTTIIVTSSADMAKSFKDIDNEAKLWGNSTDLIRQKQQALKDEMTKLMQQGFDPLSPKVQSLKTQYGQLELEAQALGKSHNTLKGSLQEIDGMMGGLGSKILHLASNPYVLLTAAVVGVVKGFIDFTKELVEYGAQIQETSERTGLSTKSLQEYKYIAEQTGGSLETITSAVKMMTRGLETNKDTFAKLGIQIKNSGGQFLSTTDIFDNTLKVLGDMTNDTERTNIALKLFGRGALDMVPLLKEGSKGIEELKNKAHDLGLVLSDETIVNAHDFEKATDSLKATWKAYTMSLVSDSLPALKAIADALLNNAKIAASGKEYTAIFQTAQAYKAGKTSVIEYRDSLVALIEWDKKLLASNDNSTEGLLNKAVANKEIEKTTKELATVEASAAYQSELAIKNNTQVKKDNELATKAMQQAEKEIQDAIIVAREKSTTAYTTALAKINLEISEGIKTEKEASDEKKKAVTDYLGKLNDIIVQYGLVDGATVDLAKSISKNLGGALSDVADANSLYEDRIAKDNQDSADKREKSELDLAISREKLYLETSDANSLYEDRIATVTKDTADSNLTYIKKKKQEEYNLYLSNAQKVVSATQTMANDIVNIMNGSTEDIGKNFAKMVADMVSLMGPEGALIGSIINIGTAIADMFGKSKKDAENAKKNMIAAELEYESAVLNAQKEMLDQQLKNEQARLAAQTSALDKEKNAALVAAGLTEDTRQQDLKDSIADINKQLLAETDAEKIKALQKQKIIDEFEIKKQNASDESAKKQAEIAYKSAVVQQKIEIAKAKIDKESARLAAWAAHEGEGADAQQTAADTSNALFDELISLLSIPIPTPAAEGAIVAPRSGGTLMQLGEGGKTEVVFPLDKLNQFINTGSTDGTGNLGGGMVNLSIQLDSKTLYSGIFKATKNKTILISADSVV